MKIGKSPRTGRVKTTIQGEGLWVKG